ncbi:GNAT family N-acetyltransferase [Terrabacter sp. Root181]|uniref:GNAT family N-acetyltransferase n=1 Tax=Terrabacter sp. Root181 TaxID=1736484 RepID=UPI0006F5826F|nr:GNAT family N-acetyltransferase [Terrabacter sp. Root181]KRB45203.1 GCN5 family acetyltransferase [Terrabacter sp. Root181]
MAHDEQTPHPHDHPPDHPHDHPHDNGHAQGDDHGRGPVADASVRVARASDAPAVGLVQAVVFREAYAAVLAPEVLGTFEPRAFANAWRTTLEGERSGDGVLLVACAGEQVVGFAAVGASDDADTDPGRAELIVLGVHPDARRQGHGSRLLHAVVDTARGRGRSELAAWVLATDDDTRDFLTAAGMVADGAHRERVVSPDGATAGELRLSAALADEATDAPAHDATHDATHEATGVRDPEGP